MFRTDIPYQVPRSRRHFTAQHWPPVFRDPYQVQVNLEHGMRAASVVGHPSSLSAARALKAVA
jgi:hypothetical protein